MNVNDHEEQEDKKISEKVDRWHTLQHLLYFVENIYR